MVANLSGNLRSAQFERTEDRSKLLDKPDYPGFLDVRGRSGSAVEFRDINSLLLKCLEIKVNILKQMI